MKLRTKTALAVNKAIQSLKKKLGAEVFRTITFDNGSEFLKAHELDGETTQIYFAHPYSAFERGSNENYNGLIRRTFPKGTDFRRVTQEQLNRVNNAINALPRRKHNYKTAEMLFAAELENLPYSPVGEYGK